jgi:hypothetical protein
MKQQIASDEMATSTPEQWVLVEGGLHDDVGPNYATQKEKIPYNGVANLVERDYSKRKLSYYGRVKGNYLIEVTNKEAQGPDVEISGNHRWGGIGSVDAARMIITESGQIFIAESPVYTTREDYIKDWNEHLPNIYMDFQQKLIKLGKIKTIDAQKIMELI